MLTVKNLNKRFGHIEAVKGVSFSVAKGETFGLLGPNGAGKSTIISMICGLLQPDLGEIWVGGIDARKHLTAAKRIMGVVPQDVALYPTLTARENLTFWGAMYDLSGKELSRRVDEALEMVSLTDRQKDRIDTYSGGMKRRINIAASLLHQPQLLIMDEPTVGIDPQSRTSILDTVRQLNSEKGITVVYTSHYMEEVEYLCQRVGIIDHGELIALGTLDEVRSLVGSETTVRLTMDSTDPEVLAGVAAVPGITKVRQDGNMVVALMSDPVETLPDLLTCLRSQNHRVQSVQLERPNLESVFLRLTGRALRD